MYPVLRIVLRLIALSTLALILMNAFLNLIRSSKAMTAAGRPKLHAQSDASISSEMTPQDFRAYNDLAEKMAFYHSILRHNWDELYAGTETNANKPSTKALVRLGLQFCRHLKGHHDIEETYWFPVLGRKMEGFRPGHFAQEQHKEMHKGLDVLTYYLEGCQRGESELRREKVRTIMDSFGGILWEHMDQEVEELGAANMRKYWTKEEMGGFGF